MGIPPPPFPKSAFKPECNESWETWPKLQHSECFVFARLLPPARRPLSIHRPPLSADRLTTHYLCIWKGPENEPGGIVEQMGETIGHRSRATNVLGVTDLLTPRAQA